MPTIEKDDTIGYYYEDDLQWWKDSYIHFAGDKKSPKKTTSMTDYIKWIISIMSFRYFYHNI
jgi:hypothetical protein